MQKAPDCAEAAAPGLTLLLNEAALRPLIRLLVREAIEYLHANGFHGDRIAYSEQEAASLLGMVYHRLRDERRRGRISHSRGPKRSVLYQRSDLVEYLLRTRTEATADRR